MKVKIKGLNPVKIQKPTVVKNVSVIVQSLNSSKDGHKEGVCHGLVMCLLNKNEIIKSVPHVYQTANLPIKWVGWSLRPVSGGPDRPHMESIH